VNENLNTSVPEEVSNALYNMSDHLPVALKLKLNVSRAKPVKIQTNSEGNIYISNPVENTLQIRFYHEALTLPLKAELYSTIGEMIFKEEMIFNGEYYSFDQNLTAITKGLYILKISDNQSISIIRKILKN
jgi:hypothetical protein